MIDGRKKYLTRQYSLEISYWIAICLSFVVIRFAGFPEGPTNMRIFYDEMTVQALIYNAVFFGLILGLILGTFRTSFQRDICSSMSVGQTLIMSTFFQYVLFVSIYLITFYSRNLGLGYPMDTAFMQIFNDETWQNFTILSVVFLFASMQLNLFVEADKKLGLNVVGNLLLGKYHNPKQEQRVFMFLDMKGSTAIAEHLGHDSYSKLLQSVYKLLTDLVINYQAEIYQYVGDEVVLTWKARYAHENNNVLNLFYSFLDKIDLKKEDYKKQYGISPEFKAGVHEGLVSVAEVGEISTQIAYHGDVVNSTSRIQELCNEYNTNLVLSDAFVRNMNEVPAGLKSQSIDIILRGKSHNMTLFFPHSQQAA